MTISEGLGLTPEKGRVVEIPNVGRDDLPKFLAENGYTKGAEIGVYKGEYTEKLLEAGLKVYGVDPYLAFDDYDMPNRDFQGRQDELFQMLLQKLVPRYPKFTPVRKYSMDAVKDFDKGSLDFVYIDGHHGFKYVAEDLWEWSKIVRPGGIMAGHDYAYHAEKANDPCIIQVRYALDAWIEIHNIQPLYILGRRYSDPGEIRDKWRSWMYINPVRK